MWVALMAYKPFVTHAEIGVSWQGVSERGTLVFTFVIAISISIALSLMLAWHLYLSMSAQTTIEFYFNKWQATQAMLRGEKWKSIYDLGYKRNFQYFFNAMGRFYWLTWCLPSFSGSFGDGVVWKVDSASQNDLYHHAGSDHNV